MITRKILIDDFGFSSDAWQKLTLNDYLAIHLSLSSDGTAHIILIQTNPRGYSVTKAGEAISGILERNPKLKEENIHITLKEQSIVLPLIHNVEELKFLLNYLKREI